MNFRTLSAARGPKRHHRSLFIALYLKWFRISCICLYRSCTVFFFWCVCLFVCFLKMNWCLCLLAAGLLCFHMHVNEGHFDFYYWRITGVFLFVCFIKNAVNPHYIKNIYILYICYFFKDPVWAAASLKELWPKPRPTWMQLINAPEPSESYF